MPQFGIYRIGHHTDISMSIIIALDVSDAKRQAIAAIEAEKLDAIHVWDGRKVIEIRPAIPHAPILSQPLVSDRINRMLARKAEGATKRVIADEFGISPERVREILGFAEKRRVMREGQPNRASLSIRAQNALPYLIDEPETDVSERDRLLPDRVAALTRRDIEKVPNIGKKTIVEIAAWLWERSLVLTD